MSIKRGKESESHIVYYVTIDNITIRILETDIELILPISKSETNLKIKKKIGILYQGILGFQNPLFDCSKIRNEPNYDELIVDISSKIPLNAKNQLIDKFIANHFNVSINEESQIIDELAKIKDLTTNSNNSNCIDKYNWLKDIAKKHTINDDILNISIANFEYIFLIVSTDEYYNRRIIHNTLSDNDEIFELDPIVNDKIKYFQQNFNELLKESGIDNEKFVVVFFVFIFELIYYKFNISYKYGEF